LNNRRKIPRDKAREFVNELHEIQLRMIEAAVVSREKQGFPEANEVIEHIKHLGEGEPI